jgi:hypothetical protein
VKPYRLAKWGIATGGACALLGIALAGQQHRTLSIAGHPGEVDVTELNGRYFVEIDALRQLLNAALTLNGSHYVLAIESSSEPPADHSAKTQSSGFSKEFLTAAIEQMSSIREWRSTLVNAVERGYPITEDGMSGLAAQARENLRHAFVAVSTEADRNAWQLLNNEFLNMKKLNDRFVDANKAMQYTPPNSLDGDPLDKKIRACGHSLAQMAANGQFVDDGSCAQF